MMKSRARCFEIPTVRIALHFAKRGADRRELSGALGAAPGAKEEVAVRPPVAPSQKEATYGHA